VWACSRPPAQSLGVQAQAKERAGFNGPDIGGGVGVALRITLFVQAHLGEHAAQLGLRGAGRTICLFAAPSQQLALAHRDTGAVEADAPRATARLGDPPLRPPARSPTGKMVFTVLGAVAELERSLIAERVRAGLRNAKAKGKRLGRPRKVVDASKIAKLRGQGRSWRTIARQLGMSARSARRAGQNPPT